MDLSLDVTDRALEIVRNQIEEAATQAKVEASNLLLRELEEEKAAKKVQLLYMPVSSSNGGLINMAFPDVKEQGPKGGWVLTVIA